MEELTNTGIPEEDDIYLSDVTDEPAEDDTDGAADEPDDFEMNDDSGDEVEDYVQPVSEPALEPGPKDVYVYDVQDDEPVDDKDLYRDFSAEAVSPHPSVSESNVISAAAPTETASARRKAAPKSPAASETAHRYDSEPHRPARIERELFAREEPDEDAPVPPNVIKVNKIYIANTVISVLTLCAVAAGIFSGYSYLKKLDGELAITEERVSQLESGKVSTTEKKDYTAIDAISLIDEEEINEPAIPLSDSVDIERGKLLLYDSYVGYSWVPIISGVKPNTYIKENFHVDNDYKMEYIEDGEVSSYFGVDVSAYQGDINWDAARADGVEFAILRIGVRGYGEEGNIKLDDKFFQNYDNAHKAGIDLGVYFYSQAISVDEAVEEAEFVLEQLDGRRLEYPVVFDWEPVDTATTDTPPRTEDIMPGTLTLAAVAFLETIRDAGYESMIYTNKKMAYIKYDMRMFKDYPVWLALYSTDLTYYYDFDIWQYGFGRIDGIDGDVDLDIAMIR